ncbi:ankyrin repeat domain-containing protein [Rhodoferax sp.]|uniref:ankyrin repeat domain-containing protein n=1 Tax=Rhodoferax sp. TaxID=50421 RepID=UPI002726C34B|nr:ankyrin repeat domain-containing protein [Rhodoferax sp.]MDO9196687.1 ankyrin repeat domain-containing protein [Rhodoferax sp.]
MRSSKFASAIVLVAGLLGGCAMGPDKIAYRERLEMGFVTPADIERFKTPAREQLALVADARASEPRFAQAQDLELMQAAGAGDVARITALLTNGAHVNAIDAWGNSALLNAAREGQVESARLLLKAGADVDGRDGAMSPLAAAALRGHTILVRLLIRNDANVNAPGKNELSALMNAVKLNRLGVVKTLIEADANTRVLDRSGDNLLVVAVTENYPDMLALLLKQGVDPDLADSNGLTALYWAEYLNRPALAQLLRTAGADPARRKSEVIVSQPYSFGEF